MPLKRPTQHQPTFVTNLLSSAIALALLGGTGQSLAQSTDVEEVLVTGSYIRRSEGIIAASPLTSFSADDIEAQGTVNMAQVVQNLTFNNGTAVTNSIQGVVNTISNFNLRGQRRLDDVVQEPYPQHLGNTGSGFIVGVGPALGIRVPDVVPVELFEADKIKRELRSPATALRRNQDVHLSVSAIAHVVDEHDLPAEVVTVTVPPAIQKHP